MSELLLGIALTTIILCGIALIAAGARSLARNAGIYEHCGQRTPAATMRGPFYTCDSPRGHTGPHNDSTHRVSWIHDSWHA